MGYQMKNDFAAGAAASLKTTANEVMAVLGHQDPLPTDDLRDFLNEKLGDLAIKWYRKGFNRGHKESHAQTAKGRVPKTLRHDATRQFFSGGKRTVHLKSVLP
jgi:hypothetical protein